MEWYFIVLIVVSFLFISQMVVSFIAFKAIFGRKLGEGSFKDLDLSNTLYKNHEKKIKEEYAFLESLDKEDVYIKSHDGLKLRAPIKGKMSKEIFESITSEIKVK